MEDEKYNDLGGVYFPILQQDGSRTMVKIGDGKDVTSILFLEYLRQHDRHPPSPASNTRGK